ncbi:secreted protein [Streptomyces albidoflavus]|nr:secreted protein [Streptomyces albidoflavus]
MVVLGARGLQLELRHPGTGPAPPGGRLGAGIPVRGQRGGGRLRRAPSEAAFAEICEETGERAGRKRIALVLDFGTAADAPEGERPPKPRTACASVAEEASAADALAAVAPPLRYDSSAMLCAIDGYPRTGCGEQVSGPGEPSAGESSASPGTEESDSGSAPGGDGPSAGLLVGVGAVAVLGVAALWQSRRRRG